MKQMSAYFDGSGPLSFSLTEPERRYLREKLQQLTRGSNEISLLGKVVQALRTDAAEVLSAQNCWNPQILKLAGGDRDALKMAKRAAAMAAIGRGVYAALVERLREKDRKETLTFHQMALEQGVADFREVALELDIDKLTAGIQHLSPEIVLVLRQTKDWLKKDRRDLWELYGEYEAAERTRKKLRSRLSLTANGRRRRDDWTIEKNIGPNGEEKAETDPLHYRWYIVTRLLSDLQGERNGEV